MCLQLSSPFVNVLSKLPHNRNILHFYTGIKSECNSSLLNLRRGQTSKRIAEASSCRRWVDLCVVQLGKEKVSRCNGEPKSCNCLAKIAFSSQIVDAQTAPMLKPRNANQREPATFKGRSHIICRLDVLQILILHALFYLQKVVHIGMNLLIQ